MSFNLNPIPSSPKELVQAQLAKVIAEINFGTTMASLMWTIKARAVYISDNLK